MHDLNPLLDPENVPIMPQREQLSGTTERADMNLLDLLAPVERGKTEDVAEEPPWVAEFLGQYRLVFGNSGQIAPPLRNEADSSRIEKSQPGSAHSLPDNLVFGNFDPIPSEHREESSSSAQGSTADEVALVGNWTWIHSAIATALVALVAALLLIFLRPRGREIEGKGLPAVPIVQSQFTKSVASMSTSELPEAHISADDVGSGVPLRKVLPTYPSAALSRRLEGDVALEAEITRDGKVSGVTVLSGDPILARAAADAVRQWVYASSTSDADPREQRVTIRFKAP